jgi:hypothetical protein
MKQYEEVNKERSMINMVSTNAMMVITRVANKYCVSVETAMRAYEEAYMTLDGSFDDDDQEGQENCALGMFEDTLINRVFVCK